MAWLALSDAELRPGQLIGPALGISVLLFGIALAGRVKPSDARMQAAFERIRYGLQGLIFLQAAWIAVRLLNHLSMATEIELTDARLAAWDAMLGLDWMGYFRFVHDRPLLIAVLSVSYTSLTLLSTLAFFIFALRAEFRRTAFFLDTFLFTAIICTGLGMLFPAEAAVAYHVQELALFPNFSSPPGLYHLQHLMALRSGDPVSLDLQNLPGLVTFPSFHTAAGVVLAFSAYGTRMFPVFCAYSAVMIASTPVFGGHYFVDLFAGGAVAVAVIWFVAMREKYRGLFRLRPGTIPAIQNLGR